jgi:hypothetical protein
MESLFLAPNFTFFYTWHKKYQFFVKRLWEHKNIEMYVQHFFQNLLTFYKMFKIYLKIQKHMEVQNPPIRVYSS